MTQAQVERSEGVEGASLTTGRTFWVPDKRSKLYSSQGGAGVGQKMQTLWAWKAGNTWSRAQGGYPVGKWMWDRVKGEGRPYTVLWTKLILDFTLNVVGNHWRSPCSPILLRSLTRVGEECDKSLIKGLTPTDKDKNSVAFMEGGSLQDPHPSVKGSTCPLGELLLQSSLT